MAFEHLEVDSNPTGLHSVEATSPLLTILQLDVLQRSWMFLKRLRFDSQAHDQGPFERNPTFVHISTADSKNVELSSRWGVRVSVHKTKYLLEC